jgi:iron complex outermembrane receptor protein
MLRLVVAVALPFLGGVALAQEQDSTPIPAQDGLKRLTFEALLDVEVTSVSRRPEKLVEAPSAIQVVTGEDIRRSGATNLPEALRLALNLQIEQSKSYDWAITSRGFNTPDFANSPRANKLLVLIDGRTVYTPLFAGVLWDAQDVLLEDIDRIEVISGPGGTQWGANAVNGVINIITRSAAETRGWYAAGAAGSQLKDFAAARFGTRLGPSGGLRVYGQRLDHKPTEIQNGNDAQDEWNTTQGGFRADWGSGANSWTVQGDAYIGEEQFATEETKFNGQNLLARYSHTGSAGSEFRAQVYFDRTWRHYPQVFAEDLQTWDLDLQHRFLLGARHSVVWGAGFRAMHDQVENGLFVLDPADKTLLLYSAFLQDQIALVPDRLKLTIGTKLEHNSYSGFEIQPSGRLAWTPDRRQTLWAAVSRAVRSPSRADTEFSFPLALLSGSEDFTAERVIAYELGYRIQSSERFALSLAGFVNEYDDLRTTNLLNPPTGFEYANDMEGRTWGFEVASTLRPADRWRLRAGYIHFETDLEITDPAATALTSPTSEANDPADQVVVHSILDLPGGFQLDLLGRHVGALPAPTPRVESYVTVDARLAWHSPHLEVAVIGQNLAERRHTEFGTQRIPRSGYVRVTVRW